MRFSHIGHKSARQAIINETILLRAGLDVDVRHLITVSDVMTSSGEVRLLEGMVLAVQSIVY